MREISLVSRLQLELRTTTSRWQPLPTSQMTSDGDLTTPRSRGLHEAVSTPKASLADLGDRFDLMPGFKV